MVQKIQWTEFQDSMHSMRNIYVVFPFSSVARTIAGQFFDNEGTTDEEGEDKK